MISIEQQQKLLLNISRRLERKITVYAVGGTAMMFLGFKDSTLDVDLVFENEDDRAVFKKAIRALGYQKKDSIQVYAARRNQPQMFTLGDERFDLFVVNVIDFIFSGSMQKRAEQIHQFGSALFLRVADPHDIMLMKCATDRLKDKDDARKIISSAKINWGIIVEEAKNQIRLGKERAAFDLGCFLEDLKYKMGADIPKKVLDELFEVVKAQAKEKQTRSHA